MILVSVFAVISTVNSSISFLSYRCAGMPKINLMPEIFLKRNKRGAYYVGILMIGVRRKKQRNPRKSIVSACNFTE